MSAPPQLSGLPRLDPAEAELRRQLLAALSGRPWRHGLSRAAIPPTAPDGLPWFHCRNGSAFHFARLSGAIPAIRRNGAGFDGVDAAAALEAAEPLLADVETALGVDLEPIALEAAPPRPAVTVRLQEGPDHLHLAWPLDVALVPVPPIWSPALAADVPLALDLSFLGPRLAPHDAAGLACGDLLLLPALPCECRLEAGGWQGSALFDSARREIRPIAGGIHLRENPMNDVTHPPVGAETDAVPVSGDFTVPLTIELESSLVPLRHLQALQQGTVLPLEGSGSLPVLVRVSGQRLAKGHLVSVGEGFGVLIDERTEG